MNGNYQEVSRELFLLGEDVFNEPLYHDAATIARTLMRRVRVNVERLVDRLKQLEYQFGAGVLEEFSPEEQEAMPVFRPPTEETLQQVILLEQRVGPLPLSLKCWYEEVGTVNLIGLFPPRRGKTFRTHEGCLFDPLFIYSVEVANQMVTRHLEAHVWDAEPTLSLSPDASFKYGYGGSAPYSIQLPSKTFDAPLLFEPHRTTFIEYLRTSFRWGGFPGLSLENSQIMMKEEIDFLTEDFLPF